MPTKTIKCLRLALPVRPNPKSTTLPKTSSKSRENIPRTHALNVFEILELILLHLPMRDLLLAQLVCSRWKAVIDASIHIQRALYFLPRTIPDRVTASSFDLNPLIQHAFRRHFLLEQDDLWPLHLKNSCVQYTMVIMPLPMSDPWEGSFKERKASWKRMLITQPPVTVVNVLDQRIAPDYDEYFNDRVQSKEGVRLGDVLDLGESV
ncbi:hypothetical protein K469DRAFT_707061 [Zopfia rhizophila CBS 207.26]|uniref:F-box domain-containing protein n=1 Tax=Zopfia rhizophila CBS 207.26 TaxID=1314779 RepID=A0A6A6E3L2_9PEZI|nr:hypothetical protein K469DRAFT_707061 [Zopfia rhizophila CBS 207.26]